MNSRFIAVGVLTVATLCSACDGPKAREGASLQVAVDRYRAATNAEKPTRLAELSNVACSVREVCQAKTACLDSFRATAEALTLRDEVVKGLADVKSGELERDDDRAAALPMKLEVATARLNEGNELLAVCEQALVSLRIPSGH